jgi:hypothetical protein
LVTSVLSVPHLGWYQIMKTIIFQIIFQKKSRWIGPVFGLMALTIAFLLGSSFSHYYASIAGKQNDSGILLPWQKVSLEQVEQILGCNIPIPNYLPQNYSLREVYIMPPPKSDEHPESSARQLQPFYLKFKSSDHVIIMSLYGGDTRDEESVKSLGDIPAAFDLKGQMTTVNGSGGIAQSNLDEPNAFNMQVHTRLIWRFPCVSSKFTNLKAIFLTLESDSLSTSDLLRIAASVNKPE